jgi:hypothetical protein
MVVNLPVFGLAVSRSVAVQGAVMSRLWRGRCSLGCSALRTRQRRRASSLAWSFLLGICCLAAGTATAQTDDSQNLLARAAPGTPFAFEVIESLDAAYLGDTPSHMGRDGGLSVRPNVSLGDAVYRTTRTGEQSNTVRVGTVTRVKWERVSGGLTVEFDPEPLQRIAVGDEVWIDLNPLPASRNSR